MGGKGGGGGGPSPGQEALAYQQTELLKLQQALGTEEANRTRPLRNLTAQQLTGFLKTGETPPALDLPATVQPLAALSLPALGDQQMQIRNQLTNQGIRGGQLQQTLGNLAIQGGLQRTGLLQQDLLRQEARDVDRVGIRQRLFAGAGDTGSGGLVTAFQGLNAASNTAAQAQQTLLGQQQLAAQRALAINQGTGQLAGKALGTVGSLAGRAIGAKGA